MRIRLGVIVGVILGAFVAHVVGAQKPDGGTQSRRGTGRPTIAISPAPATRRLTQINTTNVSTLVQAWSYRLRPEPGRSVPAIDRPASSFEIFQEVTPIVVNGVMYLPSGNRVVALEPETGKEIWRYELPEGLASFRGVAYWPGDGRLPARILFTSLKKLIALRADTGELDVAFGNGGHIDLEIAYSGVPAIYRNVILMGSNFFGPGERHIGPQLTTSKGEKGDVHAYDARTGKKLWDFHTIPLPGEVGNDTWGNDSWKDRTGNNVWSFTLTVDEQRGIVYMPVSGPGMNYYGGDRPGNNLFSNTTVALDAQTGKLKWYFQNIRHELWDYNLPPAPGLIDIRKDGKTIPALAQVGKSGFMFILNRENGTPVYGVEERPMAKADVPGEWYPATQPIPRKPGPLARVSMTRNDLVTAEDTTPEHAAGVPRIVGPRAVPQRRAVHAVELPAQRRPAVADLSGRDRRRELGRHRDRSRAWLHLRELEGRADDRLDRAESALQREDEGHRVSVRAAGRRRAQRRSARLPTGDRSAPCRASVRPGPA